jgi:hypothetical protein
MRPRTKFQKDVWELHLTLPKISENQESYAGEKLFSKLCFATKSKAFCLECGNDIDVSKIVRKRVTCTHCKSKLRVEFTRKTTESDGPYYFAVASLVKNEKYDFQVVRNFEVRKHYRKGEKARLYFSEVCQKWKNIDRKELFISKLINGYYGSHQGELEIRDSYKNYNVFPDIYCPTSVFRSEYVKKGITYKMTNMELDSAVNEIHSSQMETLLKAGYFDVFSSWKYYQVSKFWTALKICIRNKYAIKKPKIYLDMLEALHYLNKDLHNSHYVCPKNLKKAHDYYIQKMNEAKIGKTIAQNLKKAQEANPKYLEEKGKFFDLEIAKGPIKIIPLKSVPEFLAEGEYLNHCVFRSSYYSKKESLILSARIKNQPVETIEISLEDFQVKQCYGKNNKPSKYHKEIINIVKSNIPKIQQIAS